MKKYWRKGMTTPNASNIHKFVNKINGRIIEIDDTEHGYYVTVYSGRLIQVLEYKDIETESQALKLAENYMKKH